MLQGDSLDMTHILSDSSAGELEGWPPVATDCCHRAP